MAAKSSQYFAIQGNQTKRIYDGRYNVARPANTNGPPIQLFNPAFAYFSSKAFDPEYHVPKEFIQDVIGFMATFAAIHCSEVDRTKHLHPSLAKIIGWPIVAAENRDRTVPDAVVNSYSYGHHRLFLIISEEKNEFGDGGSDPSVQASFSFQRVMSQEENVWVREGCCFPVFLIAHAGPWLTVSGAIITSEYFIWIPIHSVCDDEQYFRVGRVLYALRESVKRLDMWYRTVLKIDENPPISSRFRFCPTPDAFLHDSKPVTFAYVTPLERDPSCMTYLAKTKEGNRVVVKFVTRYGADAHHVMAAAGFAPKLLYHGLINIKDDMPSYGNLRMVVMEYVEGMTLHDAIQGKKCLPGFSASLRKAIVLLHCQNFVFGDLREPNIMVTPDGNAQLIDFDWAGQEGVVTYPPSISPSILWAKGTRALEFIRKEHDLHMVTLVEADYKKHCSM
ncbi:hypothetical protein EV363DRAFT_1406768 [Boletus edulis]|nr:hypothetical protein EV363DRAFT_1406768 [Boletus edulis]